MPAAGVPGPLACGLMGGWWPVRKLTAVAGSAGFLVIAPGVVAGLVPWWLTRWWAVRLACARAEWLARW